LHVSLDSGNSGNSSLSEEIFANSLNGQANYTHDAVNYSTFTGFGAFQQDSTLDEN